MKVKPIFTSLFILLFLFFLDGTLAIYLHPVMTFSEATMFSRLALIGLFYISFRLPRFQTLIFAGATGILYDVYYSGIIGIYLAAFTLAIYLSYLFEDWISKNILNIGILGILTLFIFELTLYLLNRMLGLTDLVFYKFLLFNYAPTLLFNTIAYFALFLPLKKAMDWANDSVQVI